MKGTEMYTSKQEATQALVTDVLGEWAGDFDIEAIAEEVLDFDPVKGWTVKDDRQREEFWETVAKYDISESGE